MYCLTGQALTFSQDILVIWKLHFGHLKCPKFSFHQSIRIFTYFIALSIQTTLLL